MSESPIRILHVVTHMTRGGLETMLMNYDRHIDHSKIQFDFLEHREAVTEYDREIMELGGRIYRLPRLKPWSITYLKALDRFFADHPEYRIIHSHLDCMSGIPLKYAKKNGVPVRIAHAHSSNLVKNIKYPIKLVLRRIIPKYATHFFACEPQAGRWMFGGHDFSVLNNAIDSNKFVFNEIIRQNYRNALDVDQNAILLGHVGRFRPEKNHEFLIDVLSSLLKRHSDCKLLLVGEGNLEQAILDRVKALGLIDRVIFAGVRSDVNALMQAMDVFVFPSFFEGLPLVAVEAQAAGLPCVMSDRVPRECVKTHDLVTFLPLKNGADFWAEQILLSSLIKRRDTSDQIKANGFDIRENAKKLQQFYLDHWQQ